MAEAGKVKIEYKFLPDYNPKYVNGAIGGITPASDIVMNFYFERMPVPRSVTHEVTDAGALGEVVEVEPAMAEMQTMFIRMVENGVIMNLQTAVSIRNWLSSLIDQLEGRQGNASTDSDNDSAKSV